MHDNDRWLLSRVSRFRSGIQLKVDTLTSFQRMGTLFSFFRLLDSDEKTNTKLSELQSTNIRFVLQILRRLYKFVEVILLTLRYLLYILLQYTHCLIFFLIEINYMYWTISIKIHCTIFFYYYTTLPIINTVWKISLNLQIYVLVDLKYMGWNIYETSM